MKKLLLSLTGVALVTVLYKVFCTGINHTTIALSYLIVVLLAATSSLAIGVLTSILSVLCFNFFFIPPLHTLTIDDPQNWVALGVFLFTAIIASELSSVAQRRAEEAERGRDEILKLYRLSKAIIVITDPDIASSSIAKQVKEIFAIDFCALYVPGDRQEWERIADVQPELSSWALQSILNQVSRSGSSGHYYDGERSLTYTPLKVGPKGTGVLVVGPQRLEEGTLEAVATLVALALERSRFLREMGRAEALRQSDELKSAILASVSHDLRTPLTSIRVAIDNLMEKGVQWDQATINELHSIIREDVMRLSRLVENLLELARLEAGEVRINKEWTGVKDMISEIVGICSALVRTRPIHIEVVPENMFAALDPRVVSEVLVNLLENAAKYSPLQTEIVVRAWSDDDKLIIGVIDRGVGILPEEQERVFEKFYRTSSSSSIGESGTGMGLAVARGLVTAHGGQIWIESASGKGSTVLFSIPMQKEEAQV